MTTSDLMMAENSASPAPAGDAVIEIPLPEQLTVPILPPAPPRAPTTFETLAQQAGFASWTNAVAGTQTARFIINPSERLQLWFHQRLDGPFATSGVGFIILSGAILYFIAHYLIPFTMLIVVLGAPNSACNHNVVQLVRGETMPLLRRLGTLTYIVAAIYLFLTWDDSFPLLLLWRLQFAPENPTFLVTSYYTLALAGITRLCVIGFKLCLTQLVPTRAVKPMMAVVEHASLLYRTTLPIVPWLAFIRATYENGDSLYLTVVYLGYHAVMLFKILWDTQQLWPYLAGSHLPYGHFLTNSKDNCPICLDEAQNPVQLSSCRHVFCQACAEHWLENNQSCPVCRAEIQLHGMTFRAHTGHTADTIVDML